MRMPITFGRRALKKDQTPKSPKQCFFENLTLKALTYDPEKIYADDVASSQLPLRPHSFLEGERKLEYIFKLGYLPEEVEFCKPYVNFFWTNRLTMNSLLGVKDLYATRKGNL